MNSFFFPASTFAVSNLLVCFGTVFLDADRDGDDDAVVANGHVMLYPSNAPRQQLPFLFENLNGKKFVDVAPQAGDYFCTPHMGRGLARGDLDGDGDIDLAVSHLNEPIELLENTTADPNAWLAVRLIGTHSNRDAVGARVTLHTSGGRQARQVTSGESYLSHSDRTLFWGIPRGQTAMSLVIDWLGGRTQTVNNLPLCRRLTIVEPIK